MAPFRRRKTETPTPPPQLSPWTFKPHDAPPPPDDATRIAAEAGALAMLTISTPEQRRRSLDLPARSLGFTGSYSSFGGTEDSLRARALRGEES